MDSLCLLQQLHLVSSHPVTLHAPATLTSVSRKGPEVSAPGLHTRSFCLEYYSPKLLLVSLLLFLHGPSSVSSSRKLISLQPREDFCFMFWEQPVLPPEVHSATRSLSHCADTTFPPFTLHNPGGERITSLALTTMT